MSTVSLTFQQLLHAMPQYVGRADTPTKASLPNLNSALHGFLAERGLPLDEVVGSTLRVSYYRNRASHVEHLKNAGRPTSFIANRKALLAHWRKLVLALDRADAGRLGGPSPLQLALRELFSGGVEVRTAAREAGVPVASLNRWRAGAMPQPGSERHLRALERYFGAAPGALVDLLPSVRGRQRASTGESDGQDIEYRARLAGMVRDPYMLKPRQACDALRCEWTGLLVYKTTRNLSLRTLVADKREANRHWSLAASDSESLPADHWVTHVGLRECRTAALNYKVVSAFLGWLQLPVEQGGRGMPPNQAQTLAHLSDVDLLEAYTHWRISRTNEAVSSGTTMILAVAKMLCHREHGYLRRNPSIGHRAGVHDAAVWSRRCDSTVEFVDSALKNLKPRREVVRHPFEPIRAILDLPNPMDGIADAVARMDADRPCTAGVSEAIWARDRLLVTLLASNPLRARNVRELTYLPDNSGQLRRDGDKGWRIFIAKKHFKNQRGAARHKDYSSAVHPSVWPHIERYLKQFRPQLAAPGNARVFVSSVNPDGEMRSLNRRFETLSRRYFAGCRNVGPHSMRHIVATAIIKRTGNFTAAALVLHDQESTVRTHYAHLLGDDGSRWLDQAVGQTLERM